MVIAVQDADIAKEAVLEGGLFLAGLSDLMEFTYITFSAVNSLLWCENNPSWSVSVICVRIYLLGKLVHCNFIGLRGIQTSF